MDRVTCLLRKQAGVERVEWWGPAEDGTSLRLEASAGVGVGTRAGIPIGPVGALILVGRAPGPPLVEAVTRLVPLLRHRWTEERLATHSALLARRLQALDDFAAFVAHELKGPLHAALLADDPAPEIRKALHLVDSVLEAIRSESATDVWSSPGACLSDVLCDLDGIGAEVSATLPPVFPMPAAALRLVLRNLLANAAAAGAQWIRVSAGAAAAGWTLAVDDDGGDEAHDRYRSGSGIGLALCTRLVDRLGGELELRPRAHGGMRAQVTVTARVGSTAASAEQELREVSRPRPSSA